MSLDEMLNIGHMMIYVKTVGGRLLHKVWLQRVPGQGELVYCGDEKYKVLDIATIVSTGESGQTVHDYKIVGATYIVFVEVL